MAEKEKKRKKQGKEQHKNKSARKDSFRHFEKLLASPSRVNIKAFEQCLNNYKRATKYLQVHVYICTITRFIQFSALRRGGRREAGGGLSRGWIYIYKTNLGSSLADGMSFSGSFFLYLYFGILEYLIEASLF